MKLTVSLKLLPDAAQSAALLQTLETVNRACDEISRQAFVTGTFKQFDIHKLTYKNIREIFDLSAQACVRAISKVSDAYKLDTKVQRSFKKRGAIAYDDRILSFNPDKLRVSIWTLGRATKD